MLFSYKLNIIILNVSVLFILLYIIIIQVKIGELRRIDTDDTHHTTSEKKSQNALAKINLKDPTNIGVDHIVKLMETISNSSSSSNSIGLIRESRSVFSLPSLRDSEYINVDCGFTCFLQPLVTKLPGEREQILQRIGLNLPINKINLLECASENSHVINQTLSNKPVHTQCVSHFTARLLHLVFHTDSLDSEDESIFIFTSNTFTQTIYKNLLPKLKPITDLYLTINIPIFRFDQQDINLYGSWLKYLSLNGNSLRYIDVMLLSNLSLDYFTLQGCYQQEENIVNPQKYSLPDPRISNLKTSCLILWKFICPNLNNLVLMADQKTHKKLCPPLSGDDKQNKKYESSINTREYKLNNKKHEKIEQKHLHYLQQKQRQQLETDKGIPTTNKSADKSIRKRRSLKPVVLKDRNAIKFDHLLPQEGNYQEKLNSELHSSLNKLTNALEKCLLMLNKSNEERESTQWFKNVFGILIGILILMLLILIGTLSALCYFLKKYALQRENKIR